MASADMLGSSGPAGDINQAVARTEDLVSDDDIDEEDIDETLSERLWGLTEMFPERVRNVFGSIVDLTVVTTKTGYSLGRSLLWIAATSASILVLPVIFESERAQQQEQQLQQQRQILLGPNAAVSGSQNLLPGMMPGVIPVPSGTK